MATLIATPKQLVDAFKFKTGEDYKQYSARGQTAFEKLQAESDALPEGDVVGALVMFPYADSYAIYRVVSAKPLRLYHIPYSDAWHVSAATIRGLRLADVQRKIACDRRLKAMFAPRESSSPV